MACPASKVSTPHFANPPFLLLLLLFQVVLRLFYIVTKKCSCISKGFRQFLVGQQPAKRIIFMQFATS